MPANICTRCGFPNSPSRGACLMCLNNLLVGESGPACPTCSTSNPRGSHFCRNCGAILEASGVPRVPNSAELAAMVMEAVGGLGVTAGATTALGPSDFDEGDVGDFVEEGDDLLGGPIEEAQQFAPPPAPVGKPEVTEVPQAAIPGPILETPAEPAMPEIDLDEDFAPPPPPGVVSPAEQELTPPPLGGEEEEEFAPPPPPGVVPAADAFAAPPPPPGVVEADEFLPPPPPPGALDAEEALAPPPPPPGLIDSAPELVPPPPPPPPGAEEKKAEEGEDEFGDWELDFESEEDDKEKS